MKLGGYKQVISHTKIGKNKMKTSTYVICLLVLLGSCKSETLEECRNNESKQLHRLDRKHEAANNEKITNITANIETDTLVDTTIERCKKWFENRKHLESIKYKYFIDSIYAPAIINPNVPSANKKVIASVKKGLEEKDLSKLFYPIYRLRDNMTSIVSYDYLENRILTEALKEEGIKVTPNSLLHKSKNINIIDTTFSKYEQIYYYKKLDTLKTLKKLDNTFQAIGLESFTSLKVKDVGFLIGECLEFITYKIDQQEIPKGMELVIGSSEELVLEFENNKYLDELHKKTYEESCYDCTYNYEQQISFAKLSGVKDLYFCYADSFPINNEYNYPSRSLTMIMNDTSIVDLWFKNIDLFGCSCL